MGVMGMISQAKAKFRQIQSNRSQRENIARAEELKRLKEERIRLEGKAKLEEARQREAGRITQAKATLKSGRGEKIRSFAKGLKKTIDASKQRAGNRDIFGSGGKGINTGGSGFDFGGSKPKEIKPKRKQVIINL